MCLPAAPRASLPRAALTLPLPPLPPPLSFALPVPVRARSVGAQGAQRSDETAHCAGARSRRRLPARAQRVQNAARTRAPRRGGAEAVGCRPRRASRESGWGARATHGGACSPQPAPARALLAFRTLYLLCLDSFFPLCQCRCSPSEVTLCTPTHSRPHRRTSSFLRPPLTRAHRAHHTWLSSLSSPKCIHRAARETIPPSASQASRFGGSGGGRKARGGAKRREHGADSFAARPGVRRGAPPLAEVGCACGEQPRARRESDDAGG